MAKDNQTAQKADDVIVEPPVTEPVEPAVEPGTEPTLDSMMTPVDEPGTEPPVEPAAVEPVAVEPEPQPVEPAATEPPAFDITQDPEYKKLLAENQQMSTIRDIVLGDEEVYNFVDKKLKSKSQPQPQTTEPQPLQMPAPPQYMNMEELGDPNSDTSKYFAARDQVLVNNAVNATTTAMDKKFAQNEQQNAEKTRQNNLAQSFERVKKTLKMEPERAQKAMDVFNNPNNYDLDTFMQSMIIAGDAVLNKSNTPITPEPGAAPVTPQPIVNKTRSALPNYSDIGGKTPEPNTLTEDEFLSKDLEDSLAKQGRRVTNRK